MTWWRRAARNRLLDVGAVMIALLHVIAIARMVPSRAFDFDFNHDYVSGLMLLRGQNPYTTSHGPLCAQYGFAFQESYLRTSTYPPSILWLFAPLALLPPRAAFAVWVAAQAGGLGVILWLTRRLLGGRLSARGWRFVCCAALASTAVYWHFFGSNAELILAAVVLAGYALHKSGRHTAACLAVTVAGVAKLYPLFLLPWFVWRSGHDARARVSRAALAATLALLTVALTGPGLWRDFVRHGLPVAAGLEVGYSFHYSLPALVVNLGYAAHAFVLSGAAQRVWWALSCGTALAIFAWAYGLCLRAGQDQETEFCLLCVAMVTGTISAQGHYFVYLILPTVLLATRVASNPSARSILLVGILLLVLNLQGSWATPFLDRHMMLKVLVNSIPVAGLVGLGLFFGNELHQARTGIVNRA